MKKDDRVTFTLRLDREFNKELDHLLIDLDMKKTEFIIEAIQEKMKKEKKKLQK